MNNQIHTVGYKFMRPRPLSRFGLVRFRLSQLCFEKKKVQIPRQTAEQRSWIGAETPPNTTFSSSHWECLKLHIHPRWLMD